MSPEERQLLTGLFDRTRNAATTPRDPEAEALIADQVRGQPYAPYLLAQAVLVQEQALKAANEKLQALEAEIQEMEQQSQQSGRGAPPAGGGFLSGLGSLFGASSPPPPPRGPAPGGPWQQSPQGGPWQQSPQGGYGQDNYGQGGYGQQNYGVPQSASPWGSAVPQAGPQAGGFLKGALGAAAGVAGGVLLADSIRGLFGGHQSNSLGIGQGLDAAGKNPGGETIVNNYYENSDQGAGKGADADHQTNIADNDYSNDEQNVAYDDSSSSDGDFDV
jgi:uncharacterized protein